MARPPLFSIYRSRRMAALTGLGFASGLPYVLASDTLAAWLSDTGIDVATIGLFSLIALPYALKLVWAPLMDRFVPPGLLRMGRRRGWLAATQALLAVCLAGLAWAGPTSAGDSLAMIAVLGTALVFLSASQDIVADAYRVDVLEPRELGAGAAVFVSGYRIAMIAGGAFTLIMAQHLGWRFAYMSMTLLMAAAVVVTYFAPQPQHVAAAPASLREAVTQPVKQFLNRGLVAAGFLVLFVLLFRLPDFLATRMTMPLLLKELQFSLEDVGWIRQMLGFFLTIVGAVIGGGLVARWGLMRGLIVFGILQSLSNAGFLVLASAGPNLVLMGVVIGIESFCGGLVAAGFVAFLMSCCDKRYSATQYALLTAVMALALALGGAISGFLVEHFGYAGFFLLSIVAGVPGLAMLPWLHHAFSQDEVPTEESALALAESPA